MPDDASTSDPLQAYQVALERRGYAADAIARRLRLAQRILDALDPADTSNEAYREAVARVSAALADPASVARCQQVARDFLPFFVEAGRRLPNRPAAPPDAPQPQPIRVTLPPHDGLDDLIEQARRMALTPAERDALRAYAAALERADLHDRAIERRLAIARLLLLALRPLERSGRHYRAVIEALLPLFTRDETRSYFLGVARDFHALALRAGEPRRD